MMRDYRVFPGLSRNVELIVVTCQECGTEMVFAEGVRLEDIGNAVTAHETDADNSGCKRFEWSGERNG
jgi:RNase P subunit RPR2